MDVRVGPLHFGHRAAERRWLLPVVLGGERVMRCRCRGVQNEEDDNPNFQRPTSQGLGCDPELLAIGSWQLGVPCIRWLYTLI